MPKGTTQSCSQEINIQNQSLQDSVDQLKKAINNAGNEQVLSQENLTIDGHQAVDFRTIQQSSLVTDQYFVYANGNTYALPAVYESDNQLNPMSAKDSLIMFESVKIQ